MAPHLVRPAIVVVPFLIEHRSRGRHDRQANPAVAHCLGNAIESWRAGPEDRIAALTQTRFGGAVAFFSGKFTIRSGFRRETERANGSDAALGIEPARIPGKRLPAHAPLERVVAVGAATKNTVSSARTVAVARAANRPCGQFD
jgi:hypothetical protein